jgi:hypothetical protein
VAVLEVVTAASVDQLVRALSWHIHVLFVFFSYDPVDLFDDTRFYLELTRLRFD